MSERKSAKKDLGSVPVQFYLSNEAYDELVATANTELSSVSRIVRVALHRYMSRQTADQS